VGDPKEAGLTNPDIVPAGVIRSYQVVRGGRLRLR
jgi:hypothetical protein